MEGLDNDKYLVDGDFIHFLILLFIGSSVLIGMALTRVIGALLLARRAAAGRSVF